MWIQQCKTLRNNKKKKSKKYCESLSKEHNNFLVTNPKEMEINRLPGKEFKILISITFGHTAWHVETEFPTRDQTCAP